VTKIALMVRGKANRDRTRLDPTNRLPKLPTRNSRYTLHPFPCEGCLTRGCLN